MRILIDLQGCQTESRFRGIGRYSRALTKEIVKQAASHDIWLVLNKNFPDMAETIKEEYSDLISNNHIVMFKTPLPISNSVDNYWRVHTSEMLREIFFASFNPDVVFITSLFEGWSDNAVTSIGLLEAAGKTAVTLYDLIPFLNQKTYLIDSQTRDFYFRKIDSLKNANMLLSISKYARQECIDTLGVPSERIVNISTAADAVFRKINLSDQAVQSLWGKYGITKPYIMYTGGFDSRKNLPGLLEAYSLVPAHIRDRHQLLIAGKATENSRLWLKAQAVKFGIDSHVINVDYIPDDDLVGLYNYCNLFVLPSLHEGFGLPALEAMACGAPVIGSNTTSIPEVIGNRDALFDPTNPSSIAEKMVHVLTDAGFNNFLREHGIEQTQNFSWEASARRALEAFETMAPAKTVKRKLLSSIKKQHYTKLISSIAGIPQDKIKATNQDLMDTAQSIWENEKTTDRAMRVSELGQKLHWRVEGTFHDNYSLSILTRETARALAALGHQVSLWSSNEPGFYLPPKEILSEYLASNPDLAQMQSSANQSDYEDIDIVSRNIYPPYVADMQGRINLLHHYAWEETGFPPDWVNNFNEHLQGITCLSTHVEKILIDHGVNVPLATSGCGIDHWEKIKSDLSFKVEAGSFRFLHVSSCFPRKGAELLLDAYGQVFNSTDNVSLIIKTFKNPHNQIHEWLAERKEKKPDFPHVLIIEEDLTDAQLKSLYEQCHALVGPSRAEGFGLPFAEAMLCGLPVITTKWGGQMDFCNDNTAWLLDYKFAKAHTHFNLFDSAWAEPDVKDLAGKMHEVYTASPEIRKKRSIAGRQLLLERFRWVNVAERLVQSARDWASIPVGPEPKIGWISTWNTKCGVASYSANLLHYMPAKVHILAAHTSLFTATDDESVTRSWTQDVNPEKKDDLSELSKAIEALELDTLIVQFNYVFFDFAKLNTFLLKHLNAGRVVIIVFHSTSDPAPEYGKQLSMLLPALQLCQRLLVHSINDMNQLKSLGLIDNVALFPHGILEYSPTSHGHHTKEKLIASYGFFLPHKGLLELIESISLLLKSGEKARLRMINAEYPVHISTELIDMARRKIDQLKLTDHIELITEYLPDQKSLDLMSESDLLVFPYQQTGESSSAAVRYGLATGCPVAVTPLPIFDDVSSAVIKLPGFSPTHISQGITQVLRNLEKKTDAIQQTQENADRWRKAHSYSQLSYRLYGMIQALHRKQATLPKG